MSEILTVAQMQTRYESEWLLIEDPQTDESLQLRSDKVAWHSKDREEVYRKATETRPKRFAILYTGRMPEGTAIVL